MLIQKDTYFEVARGRLKLREEEGSPTSLIAYERPDVRSQKESRYRIVEVHDADGLREALTDVLGIRVVVTKERRLFVFDGVRIHLDCVDGLGDFIEFEGVVGSDGSSDLERFEKLLTELRHSFGIAEGDLLEGSYSDLLLALERT